ncbi:hypothetical protein BH24ACI4_BH24ACI4_11470 [soil metagenome]
MVKVNIGLRPKRSASDPNASPPRVPPSRKIARKVSPHIRTRAGLPSDPMRSASICPRVMLNTCPSKASNIHPADAMTSTSH